MNIDISGKIIAVLEPVGGTSRSTGNPWKAQSYVIETQEQFPKKVCFEVFGEDRINQFAIREGEMYTVSADIESHEYNGRWYTRLRAWRVQPGMAAPTAQAYQPAAPAYQAPFAPAAPTASAPAPEAGMGGADFAPAADDSSDLPF